MRDWSKTAVILLASGLSHRFGAEDKLMTVLAGKPLLAHAAALCSDAAHRVAVCPASDAERQAFLKSAGWTVLQNENPAAGQGNSLALAAAYIQKTDAEVALVLLGDMPFVTEAHLQNLLDDLKNHDGLMSSHDEVLMPPAGFRKSVFSKLANLKGDQGARSVFRALSNTTTRNISAREAIDIDTPTDLLTHSETL